MFMLDVGSAVNICRAVTGRMGTGCWQTGKGQSHYSLLHRTGFYAGQLVGYR